MIETERSVCQFAGARLRERREELTLSVKEAAVMCGVSRPTLLKAEDRNTNDPGAVTLNTLIRIAHAYGMRVSELFEPYGD